MNIITSSPSTSAGATPTEDAWTELTIFDRTWKVISSMPLNNCLLCSDNIGINIICASLDKLCESCTLELASRNIIKCPWCTNKLYDLNDTDRICNIKKAINSRAKFKCLREYCNWEGKYCDLQQHIDLKCKKISHNFYASPCITSDIPDFLPLQNTYTLTFNQLTIGTMSVFPDQRKNRRLWSQYNSRFYENHSSEDRNFFSFNIQCEIELVEQLNSRHCFFGCFMDFYRKNKKEGMSYCRCDLVFYEPILSDGIFVRDVIGTFYECHENNNTWSKLHLNNCKKNVKSSRVITITTADSESQATVEKKSSCQYMTQFIQEYAKEKHQDSTRPQIVIFGENFENLLKKAYVEQQESCVFDAVYPFGYLNNQIFVYEGTTIKPEINENGQVVKLIHKEVLCESPFVGEIHIIPHSGDNLLGTLIFKMPGLPDFIATINNHEVSQDQRGPLDSELVDIQSDIYPLEKTSSDIVNITTPDKSECILDNGIAFEFPEYAFEKYPASLKVSCFKDKNKKSYEGRRFEPYVFDKRSFKIEGTPSVKDVTIEMSYSSLLKSIRRDWSFNIIRHSNGTTINKQHSDANYKTNNSVCIKHQLSNSQDFIGAYR